MGIHVQFTDADWERHARAWSAWWEGELSFYHLGGKGQILHLDMLLSLERLRGIQ